MAEDNSDKESKTEDPTGHKIEKAISKGNIPVSREISILSGFLALTIIMFFVAYPVFAKIFDILKHCFERSDDWVLTHGEDGKELFNILIVNIGSALWPIFTIIFIFNFVAHIIQNPPKFVGNRIQPQFSRISLKKGFGRLFSKSNLIEFLKAVAKLMATSIIIYLAFFRGSDFFHESFLISAPLFPEFIRMESAKLLAANCIAVLLIASFDFAWTRRKWFNDLRMSRYEIKKESKDLEGDPLVKARMKSLARDRVRRQMIAQVPTATLIVANPTHFSVALRYKPPKDMAPVVIAKGQDILALKIREIAVENDIAVIENVALARALYKQVDINQVIPEEFYQAVAELIRYINRQ